MAKKSLVVCDQCGKTKGVDESTGAPWLIVHTMASPEEYARVAEAVAAGESVENLVDGGDFCSLSCLSNWASLRANMRELDAETES